MCSCAGKWLVKYPDGRTEEKANATAARIAAARVSGATYEKVPRT